MFFVLGCFIDGILVCITNPLARWPFRTAVALGAVLWRLITRDPFGVFFSRERVHVEVEDVNEFDPVWLQRTYYAEASDGQLFSRLVQLQAVDRDGIPGISKICHYQVTTPDVPFEVDADGRFRRIASLPRTCCLY